MIEKGEYKSIKKEEALKSLPQDLHLVYKQLLLDYQLHCLERYGRSFVSYNILADLIRDGWRPTHKPLVKLDLA